MGIELTALHWVYLAFVLFIIAAMIFRRDTTLICIIGIFFIGLVTTGSITRSVGTIFNSFVYAINELMGTILVISVITAMSKILTLSGINSLMIRPAARLMKGPAAAYWVIGLVMMITSWFFWPSPAVALIGAVLLPVALRAGLPALGAAAAMNLFGHGIALSGDFIIQGAPSLTAGAAGIPVGDVITASIPLVIIMGTVTTVTAFIFLRRDMKKGVLSAEPPAPEVLQQQSGAPGKKGMKLVAVLVPLLFLLDVAGMYLFHLQGGDATALVGGTAIVILILATAFYHTEQRLERVTDYLIDGLQFGFKVFGPVIPIAAFFYLGDAGLTKIIGNVLPFGSQGIVNDLGVALASVVPLNAPVSSVTLTAVGAVTGLDGSGFSGIALAGSIAKLFSTAIHGGIATLTAMGQIAAIWVGGGTLIPWALIPAAAICNVDPFDLARRNLVPVLIGLGVTTVAAMFFI